MNKAKAFLHYFSAAAACAAIVGGLGMCSTAIEESQARDRAERKERARAVRLGNEACQETCYPNTSRLDEHDRCVCNRAEEIQEAGDKECVPVCGPTPGWMVGTEDNMVCACGPARP